MSEEKMIYSEKEVSLLLSQVVDLGRELEALLHNAKRAAAAGDQSRTMKCMKKANALMGRIGGLSTQEGAARGGRPRAGIREGADKTLGQIRNAMRLCAPAGTLAGELGISESTFRRRMRRTGNLPDDLFFSQIP